MTIAGPPSASQPRPRYRAVMGRFAPASPLGRVLALVGLAIVSAAAAFAAVFVISLHDSELNAIRNRLEIPARAMADIAQQLLNDDALVLTEVRAEAERSDDLSQPSAALRRLLVERITAQPMVRRIDLYDIRGRTVASSAADAPDHMAISDSDFFARQLAAEGDQLIISNLVSDPRDGQATIVASRRVFDRSGQARGVVALYINVDFIQRLFDSLPMPSGATIALFNVDGRLLVRSPPVRLGDQLLGKDFAHRRAFEAFRDSGSAAVFAQFTTMGGMERFIAGIGGKTRGFVVTAGWDVSAALAHWHHVAAVIIAVTIVGIGVVIGLFAYILLALRRNEALSAEISRSEGKFRAIMAALPDAVMIIDPSLKIVFANRAAETLFGHAPGEMNGMPLRQTRAYDKQPLHEQNLTDAFAAATLHSGVRGLERVARRKDGSEFPIEVNACPYDSPEGRLLVSVPRDVTARQANDRALLRSRENLARAQRVAGLGSFERNLVTGAVELSDELYRIHGVIPGSPEATLEFVHSLTHPEDVEKTTEFRRAVESGIPESAIDYRIIRPDGEERVLHRECGVVHDESGRPAVIFGTLQDITERKKIELKLQQSRENLTRAQRIAGVGSFERDLVTGERELSDEFKRIWGIDDSLSGRVHDFLVPLIHPDDRQKFEEMREAAFRGEPTPSWDLRIMRDDGEERIVHPEFRVIFDENGTPRRMFGTVQDVTERKKIEIELRRSREKLARAHRIAGIGNFERDLKTGEIEWSEEFMRIWGIAGKPERGSAELLLSLVHPEDRARFMEGRDAALERKAISPLDFRIIRPDGQERTLHREYGVQFNENGQAIRMFGTVQDVTERKTIELELRRSRENLARAQRIAATGSFERDLVTDAVEWSDEMYRVLGLERVEGAPAPGYDAFVNLVHPEDRARMRAAIVAEINGTRAEPLECRIVRPDGKERIVRRESDVVLDDEGGPIRVFGTVQDVTERKKAELELLRSRENLARAQRFAKMGSFERDLVTTKGEWSEEMFRILGLEKGDGAPAYNTIMDLVHPDDRKTFHAFRAAEITGTPSHPLEYRIIRRDGTERIVRRESAVVLDEEKRAVRLYGTLQDITEQRLAERRERELERQLLHSQKLEALGTLAGGIAHDLNNTLVPIMALSKVTARRFEAGSRVRTNLETIYEASERARDLVKRVVAFSRKDEPEKRATDVGEIVTEALKLLRATIPSSIALEAKIAKAPPIPADASQLHQVVTNLVSNASQAIGGEIGTITVTLDARLGTMAGGEICLSVSDTGVGMDRATQQRIFEPFFTTKPVGQGTGLGLSIVHGIVASHGGRIEVTSAPGKGTRFDLYFPVNPGATVVTSSRPAA